MFKMITMAFVKIVRASPHRPARMTRSDGGEIIVDIQFAIFIRPCKGRTAERMFNKINPGIVRITLFDPLRGRKIPSLRWLQSCNPRPTGSSGRAYGVIR